MGFQIMDNLPAQKVPGVPEVIKPGVRRFALISPAQTAERFEGPTVDRPGFRLAIQPIPSPRDVGHGGAHWGPLFHRLCHCPLHTVFLQDPRDRVG